MESSTTKTKGKCRCSMQWNFGAILHLQSSLWVYKKADESAKIHYNLKKLTVRHLIILVCFRYLYSCKDIVLRRNTSGSLGFSIVGGYEEHTGNKPFFIKSIVGGTPAYNDGRIR